MANQKFSNEEVSAFRKQLEHSLPQVTVDLVIFRYHAFRLEYLMVQPPLGKLWLMPGGFIYQTERMDAAALRVLKAHVSFSTQLTRQFVVFGDNQGTSYSDFDWLIKAGMPEDIIDRLSQRFINIGYYAVLNGEASELPDQTMIGACRWQDITHATELGLDHMRLLNEGRKALARDLLTTPILEYLLPKNFTLPQLHGLYESILERKIDKGNFRQRMLKQGFLIKVGKLKEGATRRPPDLYKLDTDKYRATLSDRVKMGF